MTSPMVRNLFDWPDDLPRDKELFDELLTGDDVRVERIVSHGHETPEGDWYDQDTDEWVVLIQGRATLAWADETTTELEAGDAVFIPAHRRHRVASTTSDPPCVWLAIHGDLKRDDDGTSGS